MKKGPAKEDGLTYAETGVNYADMDPFKIRAQKAAAETSGNLHVHGFREVPGCRGESVYLIERDEFILGHVEEGLGTKNLVADAMFKLMEIAMAISEADSYSYYDRIAQCTLAMIFNDMSTLGVQPLTAAMHLAVGESSWFKNNRRVDELIRGWKKGCDMAGCAWGGGETPTLPGIIYPSTSLLSGSAMGIIKPKGRLIKGNIRHGDRIVIIKSSGIHANGLTLARKVAELLPQGYLTLLEDGRTYGASLLEPTIIYTPLIEACLTDGVDIHYVVNITGHGWRKLMRHPGNFRYIINNIPEPQPIFHKMGTAGKISLEEMYGNLNMGAGYALYVPRSEVNKVFKIAEGLGMEAFLAGHIATSNEKAVEIISGYGWNMEFKEKTLAVR